MSAGLQQLRWFYKVWRSSKVVYSLPFDISAHLRKSWEILRRYAADPANFFRLASSALESSDFEIVDSELTRLLELSQTSAEVAEPMADVPLATRYSRPLTKI